MGFELDPSRVARFWSKVDKTGECWLWIGGVNPVTGYGIFGQSKQRTVGAHRYSYALAWGSVPGGMFVCHRCDNRRCVNPDHLFLGAAADNAADMAAKGRSTHGERNPQARLAEADVIEIRRRYQAGELQRVIAEDFGVHPVTVCNIVTGRTWKRVGHGV